MALKPLLAIQGLFILFDEALEVNSMDPRHREFVSRAAVMAIPNADALARNSVEIGRMMESGAVIDGLDRLSEFVDKLHHFLNFIALAEHATRDLGSHCASSIEGFKHRLFDVLDRMQQFLERYEFPRLSVELGRSLSATLLEYRGFGGEVAMVLRCGHEAAA